MNITERREIELYLDELAKEYLELVASKKENGVNVHQIMEESFQENTRLIEKAITNFGFEKIARFCEVFMNGFSVDYEGYTAEARAQEHKDAVFSAIRDFLVFLENELMDIQAGVKEGASYFEKRKGWWAEENQ